MRELVLAARLKMRRRREYRILKSSGIVKSDSKNPQLSYAGLAPTGRTEKTTGGQTKLGDLSKIFPEHTDKFNILYLVSSYLPENVEAYIKLCKHLKIFIILNQNGVAYPGWHGPGWAKTNARLGHVRSSADLILYQSEFCKKSADKFLGPISGASQVCYNAVDTEYFIPRKIRAVSKGPTLLLGGTQSSEYRVTVALHVLKRVLGDYPEARLIVTGAMKWQADSKSALKCVKDLAQEMKILDRVHFYGMYTQEEVLSIYHSADLLLHTQYNDACPSVVLEAMAAGLPVVYSRSGGTVELIGENCGIGVDAPASYDVVYPPDPDELFTAVDKVWKDLRRFSINARNHAVKNFNIKHWLYQHSEVFKKLGFELE